MSPNLTWSVWAGYNFKKSWCSSTTTVLRPLLPVSHTSVFSYQHSALTGRINKFIRRSLWDSLLVLLVASVGKLFHPNNSLARTTVCFLCYVSGLKTSYRSLCDPTGPKAVLVLRSDRFVVCSSSKKSFSLPTSRVLLSMANCNQILTSECVFEFGISHRSVPICPSWFVCSYIKSG